MTDDTPQTKSESLWPEKLQPIKSRSPASILKEQASLLGQMTQNVVTADVRKVKDSENKMQYWFALIAPALQNYTLWLFQITHEAVDLYPVDISSEFLAQKEQYRAEWKSQSEVDFKEDLKRIFAHPKTIAAIQSLMVQSEGLTPESDDVPF